MASPADTEEAALMQDQDEVVRGIILSPNTEEFKTIKNEFRGRHKCWATILRIIRVENKPLLEAYYRVREEIRRDLGSTKCVGERLLFHGTLAKNIDSIVKNGFDLGKAGLGKNGKGIYFSNMSNYSDFYTDCVQQNSQYPDVVKNARYENSQRSERGIEKSVKVRLDANIHSRIMLCSLVTLGRSYPGNSTGQQPDLQPLDGPRFHSCIAYLNKEAMAYVVYRENQSFPRYLIEYEVNDVDIRCGANVCACICCLPKRKCQVVTLIFAVLMLILISFLAGFGLLYNVI